MSLIPGTRLGPYEIVAPLGAGGMGEVYRANDARLDREVAVKVLPERLAREPEALARFEREAKAVASLSHPNILAIHDFGVEGGTAYSVTELLEGEDLRGKMGGSPLPLRKAMDYALQIARGLAAAHDRGIVHRDLKPENIFVTGDGQVKILDFGLAKLAAPGESAALTQMTTLDPRTHPGTILGTLGYMSPEQIRGQAVDPRTDLFSFGAILYEMLSGRRAFRRDTSADTMTAILREDPPELSGTNPAVSPVLERIVHHCLEKDAAQRFQTARDIAFALEAISGITSTGPAAVPPGARRLRRWMLPAASAAMLVAAAGFFLMAIPRQKTGPGPGGVSYRQMSFRRQRIFNARFAPDGQTLVYSAALEGNTPQLFSVRTGHPEPRSMGQPGLHLLSVSPKGELAVLTGARYLGHRLFTGTLARMPMEGEAPREILEGVREADWAPDGESMAIIREVGGRDRLEFPVGTVLYESAGYLSDPRISPDGRKIAFFGHPTRFDDRGSVNVVDLKGQRTLLSDGYAGEEGLDWSPDGREILFSASETSLSYIVFAVDLSGHRRKALVSAGGLTLHDILREGEWLVSRDEEPLSIRGRGAGEAKERDLSWLDGSLNPAISSDGKTLLFTEQAEPAGPNYAVCLRKMDGSPVVRLGDGAGHELSPDGKWALAVLPTPPQQLVLYPTGAGAPARLDSEGMEYFDTARWFPDGKKILACGNQPGRPSRCYLQEVPSGRLRPITPEGTRKGYVSPDGKLILALEVGGAHFLYPVEDGSPRPGPSLDPDDVVIRWAPDGRSIFTFNAREIPARVRRVDLATGRSEIVRELAPENREGLLKIFGVALADNPDAYAYTCWWTVSHLYLAEGAR